MSIVTLIRFTLLLPAFISSLGYPPNKRRFLYYLNSFPLSYVCVSFDRSSIQSSNTIRQETSMVGFSLQLAAPGSRLPQIFAQSPQRHFTNLATMDWAGKPVWSRVSPLYFLFASSPGETRPTPSWESTPRKHLKLAQAIRSIYNVSISRQFMGFYGGDCMVQHLNLFIEFIRRIFRIFTFSSHMEYVKKESIIFIVFRFRI